MVIVVLVGWLVMAVAEDRVNGRLMNSHNSNFRHKSSRHTMSVTFNEHTREELAVFDCHGQGCTLQTSTYN